MVYFHLCQSYIYRGTLGFDIGMPLAGQVTILVNMAAIVTAVAHDSAVSFLFKQFELEAMGSLPLLDPSCSSFALSKIYFPLFKFIILYKYVNICE